MKRVIIINVREIGTTIKNKTKLIQQGHYVVENDQLYKDPEWKS